MMLNSHIGYEEMTEAGEIQMSKIIQMIRYVASTKQQTR